MVFAVVRVDLAKQIWQQLLGQGVPEEKIRSVEIGFPLGSIALHDARLLLVAHVV